MWPIQDLLRVLGVDLPIIQAPMAGCNGSELATAVSVAGGLGSLPCAMLTADQVRSEFAAIREVTKKPINLNFFCHQPPSEEPNQDVNWLSRLQPYYDEFGLEPVLEANGRNRKPFNAAMCDVVVELKPEVVSFHFGLPSPELLDQVKIAGCTVLCSATTVAEASWLESRGVDAIIAQGFEAGGHRGMFLSEDTNRQVGTFALVPQVADAVTVPVIAAGGIGDGRGIAAAFALGASGVQIGSAYLRCPEAATSRLHRAALADAKDDTTTITNVFTGRPARGVMNRLIREIGPLCPEAPAFPLAAAGVAPLRAEAESRSSGEFTPLWAGQAAALTREEPAGKLTQSLASQALDLIQRLSMS